MAPNLLSLTGVGGPAAATSAANPQLQFYENFQGHLLGVNTPVYSNGTLSVHAVNIPVSISFNQVVMAMKNSSGGANQTFTFQFGLYSNNASTLSLANSASQTTSFTSNLQTSIWISMITSATQNISPGAWYFAFNILSAGNSSASYFGNSGVNFGNAAPVLVRGRMTVSTSLMPATIATTDLNLQGTGAMSQPYIILTA